MSFVFHYNKMFLTVKSLFFKIVDVMKTTKTESFFAMKNLRPKEKVVINLFRKKIYSSVCKIYFRKTKISFLHSKKKKKNDFSSTTTTSDACIIPIKF